MRSIASSFNLKNPLFSLKSFISCLRLLPRLHITPILLSIFPSITCFKIKFLRKMRPTQLAFLLFIVCRIFLSSLTLHFSHDRSIWSSPSFSSTTFQSFSGMNDLFSEVSTFQYHTKLCSRCRTSLVSFLNFNPPTRMYNQNTVCNYPISKEWPPSHCPDYSVEVHEFDHDWVDAVCLKRLCLVKSPQNITGSRYTENVLVLFWVWLYREAGWLDT